MKLTEVAKESEDLIPRGVKASVALKYNRNRDTSPPIPSGTVYEPVTPNGEPIDGVYIHTRGKWWWLPVGSAPIRTKASTSLRLSDLYWKETK